MEVDDERCKGGPERRAGLETFWRWSANALLAAGTDAAVAFDAGDDGAQRRQVDVVVGMDLRQVGGAKCVGAVRTDSKCRLDDPVRVFGQRAGDARTAATGLLRTVGGVRLLTLRSALAVPAPGRSGHRAKGREGLRGSPLSGRRLGRDRVKQNSPRRW